jgi:hypothetical protein
LKPILRYDGPNDENDRCDSNTECETSQSSRFQIRSP